MWGSLVRWGRGAEGLQGAEALALILSIHSPESSVAHFDTSSCLSHAEVVARPIDMPSWPGANMKSSTASRRVCGRWRTSGMTNPASRGFSLQRTTPTAREGVELTGVLPVKPSGAWHFDLPLASLLTSRRRFALNKIAPNYYGRVQSRRG